MIATCPSCSARYKIDDSKIKGRGAKINCPRCSHRFVVYRDDDDASAERRVPDDVARLDFSALGLTWRVRKGDDVGYEFFDLATLQDFLRTGQIDRWDAISFDNREWTPIEAIDDLEVFFHDVWQRAVRGEIVIAPLHDEYGDDEDEDDAPTTIVGRGSSLASELREAIAQATPRPLNTRGATPDSGASWRGAPYPAGAPEQEDAPEPATAEEPRESTPLPAVSASLQPAAPITENEPAPAPLGPAPSLAARSPAPRRAAVSSQASQASQRAPADEPDPPKASGGNPLAWIALAAGLIVLVGAGTFFGLGLLGRAEAPSAAAPEPASALASAKEEGADEADEAEAEAEAAEAAADGG